MVGNDLVDLEKAALDSNWKRKGYLEKICTLHEQQLIWQAKDPSLLFWVIWTMKESAYKIINRQRGIRSYSPSSLQCSKIVINPKGAAGTVNYQEETFHTTTEIKDHLIHSIAVLHPKELLKVTVFYLKNTEKYMEDFNQSSKDYQLSKKNGLPEMTNRLTGLKHVASISHHGRYLAIVHSGSLQSTD